MTARPDLTALLQEAASRNRWLLLRVDFSDEQAWRRVVREAMTPADFGMDLEDLDDPGYSVPLQVADDRAFEGLRATDVSKAATDLSPPPIFGVALIADARSMTEARSADTAASVECVDLSGQHPKTFRSLTTSLPAAHANISEANLFFDELTHGDQVFDG